MVVQPWKLKLIEIMMRMRIISKATKGSKKTPRITSWKKVNLSLLLTRATLTRVQLKIKLFQRKLNELSKETSNEINI